MGEKEVEMVSFVSSEELPLVSVLMPAYNHARFVEQAVMSVWQQSYKNLELIVIDDGSSDDTYSILQSLKERSPLPFHLEKQKNQGVCKTLNKCLTLSNGEWISTLASDDMYRPDFISKMMSNAVRFDLSELVLHSDAYKIDEFGHVGERLSRIRKIPPLSGESFYDVAFTRKFIISSTIFLKKSLLLKVGAFDETLRVEDFDLHLRLARVSKFMFIDDPIFYSRVLKESFGNRVSSWSDDIIVSLEKNKEFFGDNYKKVKNHHHVRLSIGSAQKMQISNSLKHYYLYEPEGDGVYRIISKFKLIFMLLLQLPRGVAVRFLPVRIVSLIRKIKHAIFV